jgi:hypothetical protein
LTGEEHRAGSQGETERNGPAAGRFAVEPESDPGDEGVDRAVEAEAAKDGELDEHEHDRAGAHEKQEDAAFGAIRYADDCEPEQHAVEADGQAEDFAVPAVEHRVAAAASETGKCEKF